MISTLIFDFGDVFIDLDKPATEREFTRLGVDIKNPDLVQAAIDYELGLIDSATIISRVKQRYPDLDIAEITSAWNAIIRDFPENRLDFIKSLKASGRYKLFLLSNTNALHIEQVVHRMGADRYTHFADCFDHFYLSHEIHFRKPEPDIFQFVLDANLLAPERTLFIDDTLDHIQTADQLGLHTWHLNPSIDDVTELFIKRKELF